MNFHREKKKITRWIIGLLVTSILCAFQLSTDTPQIVTPPHQTGASALQKNELLSLASWNIAWFPAQSPQDDFSRKTIRRIEKISSFLREVNPAILFACEIRDLESLRRLQLDYPFIACTNFSKSTDEDSPHSLQSLALLCKIPWKEIWAIDFSPLAKTDDCPPRGILGAEFILPSGKKLTLYGVHLKSNRTPSLSRAILQRQRAMNYLEQDWQRRKLDPARDAIIVMGDFNTSLHNPAFSKENTLRRLLEKDFASLMKDVPLENRVTLKSSSENHYQGTDFDHIFFSKPLWKEFRSRPPWGEIIKVKNDLSDHYLLFLPALPQ